MTSSRGREPTPDELEFVRSRRVGHLATVGPSAAPSVVPVCYALIETGGCPAVVSSLDEKPKRLPLDRLRRVLNIEGNAAVSLVVDDYREDWSALAFVQLHGRAAIVAPGSDLHRDAVAALRAKYPQYAAMRIEERPIVAIDGLSASSWRPGDTGSVWSRGDDLRTAITGRRSVRALLPDPVPRAVLERAVSAAGWAPSPHGRQPWRFAVVESERRKLALADAMSASWQEQLVLDGQDAAVVALRLGKSRQRLLSAPALIIPCLYLDDLDDYPDADRRDAERTMAIQSLGAAIQNALLSIYASGYDAGWMCAPLFCPEIVRDALGLGKGLIPHAMIPIGRAAKDPVRRPRLPLDRLIEMWD